MAKVSKGPAKGKIPVNTGILSPEDRTALTAEAQKSVLAEMTQDARDAYLASEMERLRRGQTPEDQMLRVTVDCAPFVPHILIDGVQFFHGYTYDVPQKQAVVIFEQMQRSWQHQDEIDGRSKTEAYRRPQNVTLGPRHAGQATRGANGLVNAEI